MKIIKLLLLFFSLFAFTQQAFAQINATNNLRIIVYGNDLVSGSYIRQEQSFYAQLQQKLKTAGFEVTVEVMGNPDVTTVDAIGEIESVVGKAPDLIILQLGEADIKRRLAPKGVCENLKKIISFIKSRNIYVVFIGNKSSASLYKTYDDEINGCFDDIKQKTSAYLDPLKDIIGKQEMTLGDNYHPNVRGIQYMVDTIYPLVDTGLRWRIKVINEIRNNQPSEQMPPTLNFD